MTTTYEKACDFIKKKRHFEQTHKEETKFHYALRRCADGFIKQIEKMEKKHNRDIVAASLEYASEDDKGRLIIIDKDQYSYTKANRKLLNEAIESMEDNLLELPVEVNSYIATSIPKDLTYEQQKAFDGFVLTYTEPEFIAP